MLTKSDRELHARLARNHLSMYVKRAGDPYWLKRAKAEIDLLVALDSPSGGESGDTGTGGES